MCRTSAIEFLEQSSELPYREPFYRKFSIWISSSLAFLDPLLGRARFIIETNYRPAGQAQVCDDKAQSRKQLTDVELYLGRVLVVGSSHC